MLRRAALPLAALLTSSYTASAVRSNKGLTEDRNEICIGCGKYPEAPDYEDDWRSEAGLAQASENMKKMQQEMETMGDGSPEAQMEKIQQFGTMWNMMQHSLFDLMQGQVCMDMCAMCLPTQDDITKAAMKEEDPRLRTIFMTRGKSAQNASLATLVSPIDTILGAAAGVLVGLPVALVAFLAGGTVSGAAVGGATGDYVANKTHSSLAGGALGAVAGLSTGVVTGAALTVLTELLGLSLGAWKGIGLTAATTECKRVGFERYVNGTDLDKEPYKDMPFTSKPWSREYGLKKMRAWMKKNADWKNNILQEEIHPKDEERVHHCERVREHTFDMRHAAECLSHSQLCPNGAVVLPVPSQNMCRQFSSVTFLEDLAVSLGDDPEEGIFAMWRKMQEDLRQQTGGFDGKKLQCIRMLCEYGGFRKAGRKLHPDMLIRKKNMTEEEKEQKRNQFAFLSNCKQDYDLTLDDTEEREAACSALAQAGGLAQ